MLRFVNIPAAEAPENVAALLKIAPEDRLYFIERLRLADGTPVILERRWVPAALCPGLTAADAQGSLYAVWTGRYGLLLEGADQHLRAIEVKHGDARALAVRGGSAGLLVTSVGYLAGGQPLWFERTLYRGDTYEFHNRLGRIQSAGRAPGQFLDAEERR